MKKISARKFSILGLVLVSASAVTAAVMPAKKVVDSRPSKDGQLFLTTNGGQNTCRTWVGEINCTVTIGSSTSAANPGTSAHNGTSVGAHTTA